MKAVAGDQFPIVNLKSAIINSCPSRAIPPIGNWEAAKTVSLTLPRRSSNVDTFSLALGGQALKPGSAKSL
jgi:hypothetical protein